VKGVHTVGVDRIIERAAVAKATLYSTFRSRPTPRRRATCSATQEAMAKSANDLSDHDFDQMIAGMLG
jgi:AcrR family transcriptional regulator